MNDPKICIQWMINIKRIYKHNHTFSVRRGEHLDTLSEDIFIEGVLSRVISMELESEFTFSIFILNNNIWV